MSPSSLTEAVSLKTCGVNVDTVMVPLAASLTDPLLTVYWKPSVPSCVKVPGFGV